MCYLQVGGEQFQGHGHRQVGAQGGGGGLIKAESKLVVGRYKNICPERNLAGVDGSVRQGEVESGISDLTHGRAASTESKLVVDRYEDNSLEGDTVEQLLQAGPPCTPRACPPAETSAGSLTTFSPSLHLTGSNSSDINNWGATSTPPP